MTGYQMKRKIAAALCAVMMGTSMPFGALAEALAPAEAVLLAPQYTKIQASADVNGSSITVYASGMSNPVIRAVLDGSDSRNMNGTKYTFTDVAPGEHTVQVRYNAPDTGDYASNVVHVTVEAPKIEAIERIEKIEPAAEIKMIEAIEPVAEIKMIEAIEPVKKAEAIEKLEPVEPVQKIEAIEKVELIEPVKKAETIEKVELIEPVKKVEAIEKIELIEPVKKVETIEKVELIEPVKKVEEIEKIELIEPVKKVEEIEKVELIEPVKKAETIEKIELIEPVKKAETIEKIETVEPIKKVETLTTPVTTEPVYSKIEADVKTGTDSITVTITQASTEPMYVAVGDDWVEGKHKGDSVTFDGLTPGEYEIEVDYEDGTNVFRMVVTLEGSSEGSGETGGTGTTGGSGTTGGTGTTGGAEGITPPSSGGSGETGGSGSTGGAEGITPPTSGSTGDSGTATEVKAFTVLPVVTDGSISVVIDGASEREIEILLLDHNGDRVAASAIIGSGLVTLGKFASGSYTVRAQYVTPVRDESGNYDFKTVTAQAVVPAGVTAPEQTAPVDIQAKVEAGKDYIIITVTEAAEQAMIVSVDGLGDKRIEKGGSVRYEGLTPGASYTIEIDYENYIEGAKKYAAVVTLEKPVTLGEIKITAVTPGINKLTVSGTATAGKQLIITTTPAAAADVYAMPGESGVFTAEIACAAGTYTAVTAKYTADTSKSTKATGNWTVAAPAAKPTLTVDPIDTSSTTVIAKTTAGTIVEIKTGDYTQKVTADNSGIVRFSLPHTYAAGTKMTFVVYYGSGQSFTQTAQVSSVLYLGTLKYGDKSDAVKTLTRRLRDLGYLDDSTSRYGSTVREAVRLFQRANGLDDDGIAGPKTQHVLFSVSAIPYGSDTYPTLVRGDRGYALIYTLQQRLKDLGYYTIKVDGIYGSGTQRAVREFQRRNGLSVTGKADNATQTLLYSSAAKPAGSLSVPGDYKTLSRSGKYKSAVVPLQKRLKALGYYSGSIDGYFGSQTYRAVRNFQSRNGLTVTGVADPYTQQVLYSSSAKSYSGSTVSTGNSLGYRLLYWGCRGDAVKKLQQALIDAGYKTLVRKADGVFGQWTYDAVRAYQKDHGLAVDGIAGKNTQNALYGTHY